MMKLAGAVAAAGAALGLFSSGAYADPLASPAITAPLSGNPNPISVDAGPLGKIYVGGVASAIGFGQTNKVPGDRDGLVDMSNGQVFIQKTDGLVQFYVEAGGYSLPALGYAYGKSGPTTSATYGVAPVAYLKLAPKGDFSFLVGKLPTLIGAEYTFTFQNMNIERGLLWFQEPAVSQGVQANYAHGPLSASVSLTDGYYAGNKLNWVTGLVSYTINPSNTIAFAAGGNFSTNTKAAFATPTANNNSSIYNLMYTYTKGPLLINPYLQYSEVPKNTTLGYAKSSSTFGGAVLAKYTFSPTFSIAGRVEYIDTKGYQDMLGYGLGSKAYSVTITPTYQKGIAFVRGELSYVGLSDATAGSFAVFGDFNADKSQVRGMIETGILF